MNEFEIYLPSKQQDGTGIKETLLEEIKNQLKEMFGGYTCVSHKNEGAWKVGDITFMDEVSIVRVIGGEASERQMREFQKVLIGKLNQKSILVIKRVVEVL